MRRPIVGVMIARGDLAAECGWERLAELNKGAYVVDAARVLDDILRRMEAHQTKKRSMLRRLALADHFAGSHRHEPVVAHRRPSSSSPG